jgi:hypothetical protein
VTGDEWVAAALAAADEQLGRIAVEDPAVLDPIAEAMLAVERQSTPAPIKG